MKGQELGVVLSTKGMSESVISKGHAKMVRQSPNLMTASLFCGDLYKLKLAEAPIRLAGKWTCLEFIERQYIRYPNNTELVNFPQQEFGFLAVCDSRCSLLSYSSAQKTPSTSLAGALCMTTSSRVLSDPDAKQGVLQRKCFLSPLCMSYGCVGDIRNCKDTVVWCGQASGSLWLCQNDISLGHLCLIAYAPTNPTDHVAWRASKYTWKNGSAIPKSQQVLFCSNFSSGIHLHG